MREFALGSNAATTTTGLTVAGATTLNFINPIAAPNVNIEYLRHWVGQTANATSAQQRIGLYSQVTAFPTLTNVAPKKLKFYDAVSVITGNTTGAAGTCGINASAEGGGAKTLIWDDAFNVLNGFLKVANPPETEIFPAGSASGCSFWFPTAPSTLSGWNWGQNFREV